MKAYPIIYSRTKYRDFVPDFLARPHDLDVPAAQRFVSEAMYDLTSVDGLRYSFFTVGKYCVCGSVSGVSTRLLKLAMNFIPALTEEEKKGYEEYLHDCNGRSLTCFIGIAIPRSEITAGRIPVLNAGTYWEVYLTYLKKQWEERYETRAELVSSPELEIEEKEYPDTFVPRSSNIRVGNDKKTVILNYVGNEDAANEYFCHQALTDSSFSLVTGIIYRDHWNRVASFNHAVISDELYREFVQKADEKGSDPSTEKKKDDPKPGGNSQKKTLVLTAVLLIVIALTILLVVIGRNTAKKEMSPPSETQSQKQDP